MRSGPPAGPQRVPQKWSDEKIDDVGRRDPARLSGSAVRSPRCITVQTIPSRRLPTRSRTHVKTSPPKPGHNPAARTVSVANPTQPPKIPLTGKRQCDSIIALAVPGRHRNDPRSARQVDARTRSSRPARTFTTEYGHNAETRPLSAKAHADSGHLGLPTPHERADQLEIALEKRQRTLHAPEHHSTVRRSRGARRTRRVREDASSGAGGRCPRAGRR